MLKTCQVNSTCWCSVIGNSLDSAVLKMIAPGPKKPLFGALPNVYEAGGAKAFGLSQQVRPLGWQYGSTPGIKLGRCVSPLPLPEKSRRRIGDTSKPDCTMPVSENLQWPASISAVRFENFGVSATSDWLKMRCVSA